MQCFEMRKLLLFGEVELNSYPKSGQVQQVGEMLKFLRDDNDRSVKL